MDNLAVHKVKGVEEAIRAVGLRPLYLPPYSPDFNPIEMAWSKRKTLLRTATPTTFPRLVKAIGDAPTDISPNNCRGFFYASKKAATPDQNLLQSVAVS